MSWQAAAPIGYTLFAWWFSTGAILWLVRQPRSSHRLAMAGATVLLGIALVGLQATADDTRVSGAWLAFTAGLVVWGWQEVAFLLGMVTGPRRTPCPPGARRWRRALYALQTLLYHEAALLVLGAAVIALTWGQPNQVGTWTFVILWLMRQSAKLNVFLGVRNLNEAFLPAHLAYLGSYFRRRPMNRLFPLSVIVPTVIALPLWQAALQAPADSFDAAALLFAATLVSLGVLEHWFMVLPLPSHRLWDWGLRGDSALATRAAEPR